MCRGESSRQKEQHEQRACGRWMHGLGNEDEGLRLGTGRVEARQGRVWYIKRNVLPPLNKK